MFAESGPSVPPNEVEIRAAALRVAAELEIFGHASAQRRPSRLPSRRSSGGDEAPLCLFQTDPLWRGASPLDVQGVDTGLTRQDILSAIRESRERPGPA